MMDAYLSLSLLCEQIRFAKLYARDELNSEHCRQVVGDYGLALLTSYSVGEVAIVNGVETVMARLVTK
jgi:hypothetical protein